MTAWLIRARSKKDVTRICAVIDQHNALAAGTTAQRFSVGEMLYLAALVRDTDNAVWCDVGAWGGDFEALTYLHAHLPDVEVIDRASHATHITLEPLWRAAGSCTTTDDCSPARFTDRLRAALAEICFLP